jgi:adenine deaminase
MNRMEANLVDIANRTIAACAIDWQEGRIAAIERLGPARADWPFLLPGFIDAHVHIESSLLPPAEFARLALRHGTVATISDPHEIANVLGLDGVRFMLHEARQTPLHILFGAPSCVPATPFETAGAALGPADVATLLDEPGIGYLSEVMNFPGVLAGDPDLMAKIAAAHLRNLPVDGHAPGLRGEEARRYAAAGISTDHECVSLDEAEDKIAAGMTIIIREGSAARNFDALHPLLARHPGQVMFCTDDCHPDDLVEGHINRLAARACALGYDMFDVLTAACITPRAHYRLPLGTLKVGEPMTGALVADLHSFRVLQTYIDGVLLFDDGKTLLPYRAAIPINRFDAPPVSPEALRIKASTDASTAPCRIIIAHDGQLVTSEAIETMPVTDGEIHAMPERDILLMAVVNRYAKAPPALALVKGFGLKCGAIASSVAHDSHNIVAVGCDAGVLAQAINAVIETRGGLSATDGKHMSVLPLPVAGLMSDRNGDDVARDFASLTKQAHALGSQLRSPMMALSFMALLVIPRLKLSDKGLFDGERFAFCDLIVD